MVYLIAYDLNGPEKNYEKVEQAIKAISKGIGCRCLRSTWLVQSDMTADEISSLIRDWADVDDNFIVAKVTEAPHGRLAKNALEFIRSLQFR